MANSKSAFSRFFSAFFGLPMRGSEEGRHTGERKIPVGWVLLGLVAFSAAAWYVIFKVIL